MFVKHSKSPASDFAYLPKGQIYLDAACQSLRPQPVLDELNRYYLEHNSCGERVKYKWGKQTDQKVADTREKVLKYLGLSPRKFFVSFTLNTTYGLNLILSQFNVKKSGIKNIVTSNIEHNSPFLSTLTFSKVRHIPRTVLTRNPDGSVPLADIPERSLVVLNAASNIDGRKLANIKDVIARVHKTGGFVVIDAAQAMAHSSAILRGIDADAICFSAHKMYAPSLGVIVMKKTFASLIDTTFIGGGMVDDVDFDTFQLSADNPDHLYTKFEPGLQAWGEICALGAAIDWLEKLPASTHAALAKNSTALFDFLDSAEKVHLLNLEPNPTMSFYVDGMDSHLLGAALADQGIMARTGYFCVHYYLDHEKHLPPLIRFSLGHHTTPADIAAVITTLDKIV